MEHDVWKSIYEQFYRPLYLYALSLCRNQDDAEDLVQSTFLKAFLSYEEGGSIRYWLTKVLQNEYYNLYQRRKRLVSEGKYPLEQVPDPKQDTRSIRLPLRPIMGAMACVPYQKGGSPFQYSGQPSMSW